MKRKGTSAPPGLDHLGGDRWRVRIYAGLDPVTKKQRHLQHTFRAATQREANELAEDHRSDLRKARKEHLARKGTVGEVCAEFMKLKRRDLSPTTLQRYEQIISRITDAFGAQKASALTARQIDDWYGRLLTEKQPRAKNGLSPQSVAHHHAVLRAVLMYGLKHGMVSKVVTDAASPPRVDEAEIHPPTPDVVRAIIATTRSPDLAAALHVLAFVGCRRGELLGLAWSDLSEGRISIRRAVVELPAAKPGGKPELRVKLPKNRRARHFGVDPVTWQVLMDHRARLEQRSLSLWRTELAPDGPVFADLRADPTGQRPRPPSWVSHGWRRLTARAGVDFRLHDLRHANATWMVAAGVPFTVGADRLGHTDRKMFTNRYAHGTDEGDIRAAAALGVLALPSPQS